MNIIAAVCADLGIGKDNDLLCNIPEDKKYFRKMTLGKTVIMGRKTYESLPGGKGFRDRTNIVLSRNADFAPADAEVFGNVPDLLKRLENIPAADVFVIGGAEIYSQMLPYCDRAYITHIDGTFPADRFFPDIFHGGKWTLAESSENKEYEGTEFRFCVYVRE